MFSNLSGCSKRLKITNIAKDVSRNIDEMKGKFGRILSTVLQNRIASSIVSFSFYYILGYWLLGYMDKIEKFFHLDNCDNNIPFKERLVISFFAAVVVFVDINLKRL